MRHIFFCATLVIVAASQAALFAEQTIVSPSGPYVAYSLPADAGVVNNYPSTDATTDSSVCNSSECNSECNSGCNSGCGCGFDWRERAASAGFIAGYEFLWLKPHFEDCYNYRQTPAVVVLDGIASGQDYGCPTDYNFAPRVWLGYQFCSGFTARLRYWQFDQRLDELSLESTDEIGYFAPSWFGQFFASGGDVLEVSNDLDVDVIDFDLMQDFNWRHTRLSLGGGISYVGLRMDRDLYTHTSLTDYSQSESRTTRFEGVGPTLMAELKRQIRDSGFSVVGGVRGTVLFGREKIQIDYVEDGIDFLATEATFGMSTNFCRAVYAGWIGVQYDREIMSGTDAFAKLAWEGQYWNGFGAPMFIDGDMAFEGLGFSIGIRR